MADDLDQLEEGVGRRIIDSLGRIWNPDLHPRDSEGRFISVFKRVMAMPVGTTRSLNDVVDDAPNISVANIFRTQRGFEIRAQTRSGPVGIGATVEQMADDPHLLNDQLAAVNTEPPFPDVPKCPHCNSPSPDGGYLPGHEAAQRLAEIRRGYLPENKPTGVREGLRNLRAMFADPEIRRSIVDYGKQLSAEDAPIGREAFRILSGKEPRSEIPKVDNATVRKAIRNALREGRNQYVFWDNEQQGFTVLPNFAFNKERWNPNGHLVLRGTVDQNGNFKSWDITRPWNRPDRPNAEEEVANWLFDPNQTGREGPQPQPRKEQVTEDPMDLDRVNAEIEAEKLAEKEANDALAVLNSDGEPDSEGQRSERERLVARIRDSRQRVNRLEEMKRSLERGETPSVAPVNITDYDAINAEITRREVEIQRLDDDGGPDADQAIAENRQILKGLKAQIDSAPDLSSDMEPESVQELVQTIAAADDDKKREIVSVLPESVRDRARAEMPSIASEREAQTIRELMDEIEPPLDGGMGGPDDEIGVVAPTQRAPKVGSAAGLKQLFLDEPLRDEELKQHAARTQEIRQKVADAQKARKEAKERIDALEALEDKPSDYEDLLEKSERKYERAINAHMQAQRELREAVNVNLLAQVLPDEEAAREFRDTPVEEIQRFERRAKEQADKASAKVKADFADFYLATTGRPLSEISKWSLDAMAEFVDERDENGDLVNTVDSDENPERAASDFLEKIYDAIWKGRVQGKAGLAIKEAEAAQARVDQNNSRFAKGSKAGKARSGRTGQKMVRDPDARRKRARADKLEFKQGSARPIMVVGDEIVEDVNGKTIDTLKKEIDQIETNIDIINNGEAEGNVIDGKNVDQWQDDLRRANRQLEQMNGVWVSNDGYFIGVDFSLRPAEEADRFGVNADGSRFFLFENNGEGRWIRADEDVVERRRRATPEELDQLRAEVEDLRKQISNPGSGEGLKSPRLLSPEQLDALNFELNEKEQRLKDGWIPVEIGELSRLRREIVQIETDIASFRDVLDDGATIDGKNKQEWEAELEFKKGQLAQIEKLDRQTGFLVAQVDEDGNVVRDEDGNIVNQGVARRAKRVGRYRNIEDMFAGAREIAAKHDARIDADRVGKGGDDGVDVIGPDYESLIKDQQELKRLLEDQLEVDPALTQKVGTGKALREIEFNKAGVRIDAIKQRIYDVDKEIARLKELAEVDESLDENEDEDLQRFNKALGLRFQIEDLEDRLDGAVEIGSEEMTQDRARIEGVLAAKRKQLAELNEIAGLDVEFSDGGADEAIVRNNRDTDMPEFLAVTLDRVLAERFAADMVVTPERERADHLDDALASALAAHVDAPEGQKRKLYVYAHPDGGFFYSPIHPHYYERALNPRREDFEKKEQEILDQIRKLDNVPESEDELVPAIIAGEPPRRLSKVKQGELYRELKKLRDENSANNKRRPRVLAVVDGDHHMQVFGFKQADRVDNAKFIYEAAKPGQELRQRDIVLKARDDVPDNVAAYDIALENYVPRAVSTRRQVPQATIDNQRARVSVRYVPPPDIDVELEKQEKHWLQEISRLEAKKKNVEEGHHKDKDSILEAVEHELANARKKFLSVVRDITDRKTFETDKDRYERENAISQSIRDKMQEAVQMQQDTGKPVQVYMDGDEIEFDTKKYDSTRKRIATVTGGKEGKNPQINWKDEELQKIHDEAGLSIKSRIKNMFFVDQEGEGADAVIRLQSKVIVRNHRNAFANSDPANIRTFQPAIYKIKQNPDGTFKLLLEPEADPNGIGEVMGDFIEIDAVLRAVADIESDAIGRSGDRVFTLPENDDFANWSVKNGRLIASPNEELGIRGAFAIKERFFDDGDGGLFRKFEVARLAPGSNKDGIERRLHDDINSAKQDVDERLRTGIIPDSNISWEGDGDKLVGRTDYDGDPQTYEITKAGNGNFLYNGRGYKNLDDARSAAETDELERRADIENARNGIKKATPANKPRPFFVPTDAVPVVKIADNRRNEAIAAREMRTRTTKGRVGGNRGARSQAEAGLKLTPNSFIATFAVNDPEREKKDMEFIKQHLQGVDYEELRAVLSGARGVDVIVFDYETTGRNGSPIDSAPIQIGAIRIRDGQPVGEPFDVWINPGESLGPHANAVRPDPDNPEGPGIPVDDEWLAKQSLDVRQAHQDFAKWLGDEDVILMHFNGWGFDDRILRKRFAEAGIDKPNLRASVDALVLARKVLPDDPEFDKPNMKQVTLAEHFGINLVNAHNASADVEATRQVMMNLLTRAEAIGRSIAIDVGYGRPAESMTPEEKRESQIQEKMQEIIDRPESPMDDNFDVMMPGAEPPSTPPKRTEFKDVTEAIKADLADGERGQIGSEPPTEPQDFAKKTLQMSDDDVVDVDGRKWTGELHEDSRTEYSERVLGPPIKTGNFVPGERKREEVQVRTSTRPLRDTEQTAILSTSDGDGGLYTINYHGRALVDREGISDLWDRTFWVEDMGYDRWSVHHVDKDGVVTSKDFKVEPTDNPAIDPSVGPKSLVDPKYTPIEQGTGKSLLEIVDEEIKKKEGEQNRQQAINRLKVGEIDPRNGQKIKEIIEHDNGSIEIIYESGGRDEGKTVVNPRKSLGEVQAQYVRLRDKQQEAEDVGDTKRANRIEKVLDRLEVQNPEVLSGNTEVRGEQDFVAGRGMKIGGVWRSEMPDLDSPEHIDAMMQDDQDVGFDDSEIVSLDELDADVSDDQEDGFAMRRSLVAMGDKTRQVVESSPQFVRVIDSLDNAMNSGLTNVDSPNYSRKQLNDRIRDLVLNGSNGSEIDLSDAINFDDLIDVNSAVLRKENGYVSLIMTRSDGSKISAFTKERPSPNSYFPWLHRSLAYHGNMETPQSISPDKLKAVLADARVGTGTDGPAAEWVAHMGIVAHEVVLQRLGITPLHNGFDGFALLRRDNPENIGFTKIGDNGVPEISLHPDALTQADPVEVFLHENLHAISPGMNNPTEVLREGFVGHEEGLVHAYTQHLLPDIRRRMGYDDTPSWDPDSDRTPYASWARAYENIRKRLGATPDEFYGRLIAVHPRDREQAIINMADQIENSVVRERVLSGLSFDLEDLRGNAKPTASPSTAKVNRSSVGRGRSRGGQLDRRSGAFDWERGDADLEGFAMTRPMAGGLPIIEDPRFVRGRPAMNAPVDRPLRMGQSPGMTPNADDRRKLTDLEQDEAFARVAEGELPEVVASRYGIAVSTLNAYARRRGIKLGDLKPKTHKNIPVSDHESIRQRLLNGENPVQIAKEYNINTTSVFADFVENILGLDRSYGLSGYKRTIPEDQHEAILDRVRNGDSLASIAKDYDVHPSSIAKLAKKNGVISPSPLADANRRPKKYALNDEDLSRVRDRIAQGGTRKEMARDLGVSEDALRSFLKRNEIELPRAVADPANYAERGAKARKLTDDQAAEVVNLIMNDDLTAEEVAVRFGVSRDVVSLAMRRAGYKAVRTKGRPDKRRFVWQRVSND